MSHHGGAWGRISAVPAILLPSWRGCPSSRIPCHSSTYVQQRRIQKGRQKVVAADWGTRLNAALTIEAAGLTWRKVFGRVNQLTIHFSKHPFRQVAVIPLILFFKSSWWKIASAARNIESILCPKQQRRPFPPLLYLSSFDLQFISMTTFQACLPTTFQKNDGIKWTTDLLWPIIGSGALVESSSNLNS